MYKEDERMGLFGSGTATSISEWSDAKLIKEINKSSSRGIVAEGKLILEAKKRGLENPKTGRPF